MEKTVLVLGKRSQLLDLVKTQIIAMFQTVQQVTQKDQVEFMFNDRTALEMAKKRKECKSRIVCIVGLKAAMIPQYISTISKLISKEENVMFVVMCPEGVMKPMSTDHTIIVQATMSLKQEDFSKKQKEAA